MRKTTLPEEHKYFQNNVLFSLCLAPTAPRNLSILSLSPTSVCFGWEDQSSGVDHYAIEYSVVSQAQSSQPVEISPITQSHAMIQGLQPNTTYMIQVAGLSSNLKGPFSDTVNIIPALNGERLICMYRQEIVSFWYIVLDYALPPKDSFRFMYYSHDLEFPTFSCLKLK